MDFWTLITKMRDVIRDSQEVEDWCIAYYGQKNKIYIGYDENDPRPQTDYPLVVIAPAEQLRSITEDYSLMTIWVGYGLYDETKTTLDNVTTFDGVKNLLAFRKIVEDQLFGADVDYGGAWIESADEFLEPVEMFPFFISIVDYRFRNPDRFNPVLPT